MTDEARLSLSSDDLACAGLFYDGLTARRHAVRVQPAPDGGAISFGGDSIAAQLWPLDRLRAIETAADRLVLTVLARSGTDETSRKEASRLVLTDRVLIDWIRSRAMNLNRRDLRPGTVRQVALRLSAAAGALAVILFVLVPSISESLARSLPRDQEIRFGKAIVAQMSDALGNGRTDLVCSTPKGDRALDRLAVRLTAGQPMGYDISLSVLDTELVNAFAAPGGQIVILRGLLDAAKSPEELAGVLAHEIGHVEARDPTRLAFRAAGSAGILSMIFGDVSGGAAIGLASSHLMNTAYTRDAEAAADRFALALLQRQRIDTQGLADFFDRIDKLDGDLPAYLSSHPASASRAELARMNRPDQSQPVLSPDDWAALRAICR